MARSRGFTLLELAAVFVILAAIIAILLPALGAARRSGQSWQHTNHTVGIHKGMVLYAQGNKDWYPGLNSSGVRETTAIPAVPGQSYGTASTDGSEPVYRFAVMLRANYFSPEYMISPAETRIGTSATDITPTTTDSDMKAGMNYSFALLRIDLPGPRRGEWRATQSSQAPVVSDRNQSASAGAGASSIHVNPGDTWRGYVCYNDNHGNFEMSNVIKTAFAGPRGGVTGTATNFTTSNDDLFADNKDDAGNNGSDAAMVYHDASTYVNQK